MDLLVRGADTWYDNNLAGTYNFVQMYRSYPVYKVSPQSKLSLCDLVHFWKSRTISDASQQAHVLEGVRQNCTDVVIIFFISSLME